MSLVVPAHEATIRPDTVSSRAARIEALLPQVDTELFAANQDAKFWVGKVGDLDGVQYDADLFSSVAQLRANVYVGEKQFLDIEALGEDGTESDEDDMRSVQFAAFENINNLRARTIASGRTIVKLCEDNPLPIEKYFPEVFEPGVPEVGSVEISRFISRHPNKLTQHIASLAIIRAMAYSTADIEVPTNYCMVEKPLLDMLNFIGLPVIELGDPKDIPEQNGILYPIDINPREILQRAHNADDRPQYATLQTYFANEQGHQGQGYYDDTLIRSPEGNDD